MQSVYWVCCSFVVAAVVVFGGGARSAPQNARHIGDNRIDTKSNSCNCVCGMSSRRMRVVGGNVTRAHEFPWLAGLHKDGEFYCGATLITRRHLLTASHCVNGFNLRGIVAVFADHDRKGENRFAKIVIRRIKSASSHKEFDPYTFKNDIAILELDEELEFNDFIQPACIPHREDDYSGRLAVVTGWGRTGEGEKASDILRKVAVPVLARQDCLNSGYGEKRISESMFCAGYPAGGKDACQGDSGGPLHLTKDTGDVEVIGLVSWGRGCARPNLPGIYTKVGKFFEWVKKHLDGECLCLPPEHNSRRV